MLSVVRGNSLGPLDLFLVVLFGNPSLKPHTRVYRTSLTCFNTGWMEKLTFLSFFIYLPLKTPEVRQISGMIKRLIM